MPPFLLMLLGLPGSGKTTLARALAPHLAAHHLSSDHLRREIDQQGHYRPQDKDRVYRLMAARAEEALQQGRPVLVDATFSQAAHRELLLAVAQQQHCPAFMVELQVPEAVARQRLQAERPESEADFSVYQRIEAQFDPIQRPHLQLDTHQHALPQQIEAIQAYLRHGHPPSPTTD